MPLLQLGPVPLAQDWLASLKLYQSLGSSGGDMNSLGFQNMFGLQSLLVASGLDAPSFVWLAALGVVGLWLARRSFSDPRGAWTRPDPLGPVRLRP